ncbi:tRNA (adenosine(37)-N6)-threonylcarbamoyltransferase complex dimerization subunit type 1 TsaB [Parahaliea sp. F7430]|uniref:tRNA threonylcarbamoyladenosine biosynthesis protein TsaB n=1 Tax=Sediminihaliea albiluteola TaxID=2758564 RepID=A0A7W2TV87_9GAMM|nr:tRNA (adenosine(37)-N6)-threonylcarbamoyltransferase complex dimerization subunit type 1 TsaB [Sediminihaliea albiluteola]MBA6412526.1 tRNA (adenosine(37)-N6)-threonylcarbamoyltransferase complex dimerization subunit type 1 TsaB [Sediminihaliea albiluteola]
MANFLALDTSTDACSLALLLDQQITQQHEIIPRQHSQRLFAMLQQLLPHGRLRELGIDAVVYGVGPGSFTGLRICASAVQGLCFANKLPAIPVSTLLAQAYTAYREGLIHSGDYILSTVDAHMGELYWSLCQVHDDHIEVLEGPQVSRPESLPVSLDAGQKVVGIGSGLLLAEQMPQDLQQRLQACYPELLPQAQDLFKPAEIAWRQGQLQKAEQVCPVYVRDEVSWKKLSEQGKAS